MNIYLLRHGIAAAKEDPSFVSDSERPLTRKGVKRMRKAARGIGRLDIEFDAILTSPLIRARQTAETVADTLGLDSAVEEIVELAPDSTNDRLLSVLSRFNGEDKILLVGHEPFLGKFAGLLVTGNKDSDLALPQKKGGICHIEIDSLPLAQAGRLQWFVTPRQLRLLGR
jgi:phosphohistidine phosphatase